MCFQFSWNTVKVIRSRYQEEIQRFQKVFPVVAILGPRQAGKTTLAKEIAASEYFEWDTNYFDLENPIDLARLSEPMLGLRNLSGLVVIDEVQLQPDLFPIIRVLVDRPDNSIKFLILGSASRDLSRQTSESLAGRIGYVELGPFNLEEVGRENIETLWNRGGFPRSYLADSREASWLWRRQYLTTLIQQDFSQSGLNLHPTVQNQFLTMLAHYHGQLVNYSDLGRSLDMSHPTIKRYLDILAGLFLIRIIQPWHENVAKRQVKSPKLYIRDSGLLHSLMGISTESQLTTNPKLGASWEGFALEQLISTLNVNSSQYYFWNIHGQAELDLLVLNGSRRLGYEFKYSDAPRMTKSMADACELLKLDSLTVVYPGSTRYSLREDISVEGLSQVLKAK